MSRFVLRLSLGMILAICLGTLPVFADSLTQNGPGGIALGFGQGNGQQALALQFSTSTNQTGLSMDAVLSSDPFNGSQTVTWWLTDQLGPGTTNANVLSTGTFVGPAINTYHQDFNVFSGVNLGPGTYYVVLSTIGQPNDSGWDFSFSPNVIATGGLSYGASLFTAQGPSGFAPEFGGYGTSGSTYFMFSMTSNNAPTVPEPASFALLGFGMVGIAGKFRRRK